MPGLGHSVTIPRARYSEPLAGGGRSRVPAFGGRFAHAPAAALLTGLGAAVGPASRLRRRYADAPAAAFQLRLTSFLKLGYATPSVSMPSPLQEERRQKMQRS